MKQSTVFLIIIILFTVFSACQQNKKDEAFKFLLEKTLIANENKEKYIHTFSHDHLNRVIYPEYYGGAYINNQYELVINIIGDSISAQNDIKRRLGNDKIIIRQCDYSYRQLTIVADSINNFTRNIVNKHILTKIKFDDCYVSDENNRVVVKLLSVDKENVDEFKKQIFSSPAIMFEKADLMEAH